MKKLLSITLILTIFMSLFTVSAQAFVFYGDFANNGKCGENATWFYDEQTHTVTINGTGEIYDYGTLENGQSPFYINRLFNNLIINEGITRVGDNAFYGASIENIQLPESLISVGKYAFEDTNIKTLNIPKNVQKIELVSESLTLFYCKSINVSEENQYYSSKDGALYNKLGTNLIVYPINKKAKKFIVPSGVKVINKNACTHAKFTSIEFPNSLEKIESGAFFNSQLKSVDKYSKNLKSIGKNAFSDTNIEGFQINKKLTKIHKNDFLWCEKLEKITVNKNNEVYSSKNGVLFSKDKKNLFLFPKGKKADVYAVPNGVKTIEKEAFAYSKIKSIKFPNSLTTIESRAFFDSKLKAVKKYSTNLKTIGKQAFGYTKITEFKINKNVEKIQNSAFDCCEKLERITVDESNNDFCSVDGVLFSKNKKSILLYPSAKKGVYQIPDSVTKINPRAFWGTKATEVKLNNKIKRINSYSFEYSNLKEITIPENVKTISERAFSHSESLEKVVFVGDKLPEISEGAFNKSYDDGRWPTVVKTKFYVKNKTLKKELKTKLEKSGLIEFKIVVNG